MPSVDCLICFPLINSQSINRSIDENLSNFSTRLQEIFRKQVKIYRRFSIFKNQDRSSAKFHQTDETRNLILVARQFPLPAWLGQIRKTGTEICSEKIHHFSMDFAEVTWRKNSQINRTASWHLFKNIKEPEVTWKLLWSIKQTTVK